MRVDWKIILVLVLLVALVLRECSRPGKIDYADQAFKDTIEVLRQEKGVIQSRQEATVKRYEHKRASDSLSLSRYSEQISTLKKKVVIKRIYVQPLIDSIPTLRAFVQLQDSVIQHQEARIDSLNAGMEFQRKLNEQLIFDELTEDRIEASMQIETTRRIGDLEQQGRKKQRKSKLKGILVPVALIGGLLFGASL